MQAVLINAIVPPSDVDSVARGRPRRGGAPRGCTAGDGDGGKGAGSATVVEAEGAVVGGCEEYVGGGGCAWVR